MKVSRFPSGEMDGSGSGNHAEFSGGITERRTSACSGSDQVADTPNQGSEHYGCPAFPSVSCTNGPNGDMWMNYMDYVDDACMYMFSNDQKTRVQAVMANSPMRVALASSLKCGTPITLDAGITIITTPSGNVCQLTITPAVKIKNYGSSTLTSCVINYKTDNNPVLTQNWSGSLATGQSVSVSLPSVTATAGAHTFTCFTSNPNGGADGNASNDQSVSSFSLSASPAPTTTGATGCAAPSVVTLSATGAGTLNWYSAPAGGTPLAKGSSFTTPSLNSTTTYYVESQNGGTTGNVGPATTTIFGGGGYHNNTSTQYLTFNVLQPCTLVSALVNSGAAGSRFIVLWDSVGTQLQNIPVTFPNGTGTVTLNISLTPGSYRIGGTGMNLWRNNTGGTYPFSLSGVVNITGSSAGPGFYYYIYNWQIQTTGCASARTPVIATIGGSSVSYSAAIKTICVSEPPMVLTGGTPPGGTYSGAGVSSGSFNPTTAGVGDHTITYTGSSCPDTATQIIHVYPAPCTTGINSLVTPLTGITLYPNPTDGKFTLEIGLLKDETVNIELMNAIGQIVFLENHNLVSGNNKLSIILYGAAKGIYFVKVKTTSDVIIQRLFIK